LIEGFSQEKVLDEARRLINSCERRVEDKKEWVERRDPFTQSMLFHVKTKEMLQDPVFFSNLKDFRDLEIKINRLLKKKEEN